MAERKPMLTPEGLHDDLVHVVSFLKLYRAALPGRLDDDTPEMLEQILASQLGLELLAERLSRAAERPR